MTDVAEVNSTQPKDWQPTEEQMRAAGRNGAYPPAGKRAATTR